MENIDMENETPTNEEELQPNVEDETTEEETTEELTKAKEVAENQKIRAEKAEAELKKLKAETETPKKEVKSNEPDYGKLSYLNSNKITHPEDQKMVMDEANRLKLPLTDILNMDYIKGRLKDSNDQREAEGGAPKGKGKSGGTGKHDVDYHLAKGTTPADVETAAEVINARMTKETNANKFSEELFSG